MDEALTPEQWNELQGRIRKLYPELTDADLQYHEAVEKDMLLMVAYELQKIKENMHSKPGEYNRISPLKHYWRYKRKSHAQ